MEFKVTLNEGEIQEAIQHVVEDYISDTIYERVLDELDSSQAVQDIIKIRINKLIKEIIDGK